MTFFYSSVSVSQETVTVSRHAQQHPETEGTITDVVIYICAFPTVACQNVHDAKRPIIWPRPQVFPISVAD